MSARPINPFITGAPVSASKFIGRREQINIILSQLRNPESRGSSAISGKCRIGKTSLLHYIASPEAAAGYNLPPDRFAFVSVDGHTLDNYVDSLGLQTFTGDAFWRYVAQSLAHLTQCTPPSLTQLASLIKQDKIEIFDLIMLSEQIAADGKLVVLLLDEFEWIINNTDPKRPILLNTLRSLISLPIGKRGFALITSSEEPLNVLCKDIQFSGSPFYNVLVPIHLRPFSTTEAYELIDEYLKGTAIVFNDDDKDFVYYLSEGHPYWLQRACFEMFNRHLEEAKDNSVPRPASTSYTRKKERKTQPKIDRPPTSGKLKVFVSSTSLDLQHERQAVKEALHRMYVVSFSGMEYFGSRSEMPKEVCLEEVSCADVYVGIFAHRYGYIDPESGLSMTELEYRKARKCNILCLIYMMDKSVPVPPDHIEQEPEAMAKLKALKQDLLSKHIVSLFTNPDNLATQVLADLNNLLLREIDAEGEHSSTPSPGEA